MEADQMSLVTQNIVLQTRPGLPCKASLPSWSINCSVIVSLTWMELAVDFVAIVVKGNGVHLVDPGVPYRERKKISSPVSFRLVIFQGVFAGQKAQSQWPV
jgi:hypothetical protein